MTPQLARIADRTAALPVDLRAHRCRDDASERLLNLTHCPEGYFRPVEGCGASLLRSSPPMHGELDHDATPAEPRRLDLLSVVAPLYNEEGTAAEFHRRIRDALEGMPFELVLVDDGSTDATPFVLQRLAEDDERVRVIRLSRNFGHQAALTAGLDQAAGNAVVMLDADLQDPPELIPVLLDRWRQGSDVVYAVRRFRAGESRRKLVTARWFYRVFSALSQIELEQNAGDFRLLDRRALEALNSMRERNRFIRGMTVWVGFTQTAIPYERDPRHAGETKYSLRRMLRFSVDAISSFSHLPLQAATVLGFIFSAVAFLGIPVAIGFRIAGQFVPGITTVLLVVLLLGGIQLITLGVIGEYVGRVYDEVKRRPLYVVRDQLNAPDGKGEEMNDETTGEGVVPR